jgi:hypothetical protein
VRLSELLALLALVPAGVLCFLVLVEALTSLRMSLGTRLFTYGRLDLNDWIAVLPLATIALAALSFTLHRFGA